MVRAPVQKPGRNRALFVGPIAKGQIGGVDDGSALVEPADQMKQQLAAGLSEGQVAEFVENERSPSGVTQDHRCPDHLCLKVTASAEDGTAASPGFWDARRSGTESSQTHRWRERDSNPRSPA
jgi:hypothetical protein